MKIVLIADFDETLVHEHTLFPLFGLLSGRSMTQIVARVLINLHWLKMGFHQAIQAQMYREILTGNTENVIRRAGENMAKLITVNVFTLNKLRYYKKEGAEITVVSEAIKPLVESILKAKGVQVDRIIASIPTQDDDIYTGELEGGECVGKRKAERAKEMLDQHYCDYWVVALGNLPDDRELMELSDEAYVADGANIEKYEN